MPAHQALEAEMYMDRLFRLTPLLYHGGLENKGDHDAINFRLPWNRLRWTGYFFIMKEFNHIVCISAFQSG